MSRRWAGPKQSDISNEQCGPASDRITGQRSKH
jgi:hypothetical protein